MIKLSLTRLAVAVGGLALSLTAGAGVASADPDLGPIVNTTCNYAQVMSALQRDKIRQLPRNSTLRRRAQSYLRQFLASPPSQRQADGPADWRAQPGAEQQFGIVQQVFSTCNNY